jgi:hypothetical protein
MSQAQPSRISDLPAKGACVALVPLAAAPAPPAAVGYGSTRPDPRFVTHLIAMAELSPQTRQLRRGGPETAEAAYRSAANQNRMLARPGTTTRQVA